MSHDVRQGVISDDVLFGKKTKLLKNYEAQ